MTAAEAAPPFARGIRELWRSRLGLEVREVGSGPLETGRSLIAVVRPWGDPRSGLVLECPAPLARRAAAVLRRTEAHLLTIEEVEEAVRELAADTGALVWPHGRAGGARPTGDRRLQRALFACEGHVFRVTVVD